LAAGCLFAVLVSAAVCFGAEPVPLAASGTCAPIEAVTAPSKDVTLSFVQPGRIAKVLVTEGQQVREGDVLAQQDDTAEQIALKQLKAQADDTIRERHGQAQLDQKKVEEQQIQVAFQKKVATDLELQQAKLATLVADLSLEMVKLQSTVDKLKYEESKAHLERMQLRSSVDGKVEKILAREGESADGTTKVIRIVRIDPLWIDVAVPLAVMKSWGIAPGGKASVCFPQDAQTVTGEIVFVAAVADAGSETLTVRIKAPNPSQLPAGMHVKVSFPAAQKTTAGEGAPASRPVGRQDNS
jgi:RND family efflux transporter MFP subunit